MTKDSCYLENTTKERIMSLNSFEISKEKIFRQLISMQLFVQLIKQNKKNYNNNQKKKIKSIRLYYTCLSFTTNKNSLATITY